MAIRIDNSRDLDIQRRRMRKEMFIGVGMIIAVMASIRLMLDQIIASPRLDWIVAIKPYVTPASFAVGCSLMVGLILLVFRKRGR